MSPAITATRPTTTGACVACLLGQSHTEHDRELPVVQRSSITAPVPAPRTPALHEYLPFPGESALGYPAI
jgi:hypothetical protein